MARATPDDFSRQWDQRYHAAVGAIGIQPGAQSNALKAKWAQGYIDYSFLHWRETGKTTPNNWRASMRAVSSVEVNDSALLVLPEQREFLDAWLRAEARTLLRSRAELQTGDNRWLRARFDVVASKVTDRSVQRQLLRTALATHIEENGARGVEPLIDRYKELTAPSAADVSALRTAAAEDVASRAGHRIEVYKNAGGVGLEAHVFAPAVRPDHSLPALIWFHGGSWSTGAWSFCPLVCRLAKELGFVVIQIEYRTDERFAGSPLNAMADARDALAWVRARAVDLDIDADRIVVSGFSAGGALAAQLATMSPARHVRAALLISACVSPWGDTWFRRMVEDRVREADVSPIAHLDSLDPNVLSIHGDADEMCPHADVVAFVAAAARVGIGSRLVTISKGHHFFVFESPADRATATDAARAFLTPLSPSSDRSRRLDHE